jgi:hypothetical protein
MACMPAPAPSTVTIESYEALAATPMLSPRARSRLEKLLTLAHALPEVTSRIMGNGHIVIAVAGKTLAYYLHNHHDDGLIVVACKSSHDAARKLIKSDPEKYRLPAYLGAQGWVSLRLDLRAADWNAAKDLLHTAHQLQAPKRLLKLMQSAPRARPAAGSPSAKPAGSRANSPARGTRPAKGRTPPPSA